MEKKNGLLTAALLATVLFMGGCSSEDSEMGTPAQSGSPISFSVADVQSRTRTVYEDRLQINWVENDEIGICSPSDNVLPSVEGGSKNATYKVTALNADGHPHHAEIKPSEEKNYLKWGDNLTTPAVFYGAYPADRIDSYPTSEDGLFKMKYITNQVCTVTSSDNGEYRTEPDMKNAYMIAKNKLQPIGDHVLLSFDPIMTTPDITITAGSYEVGTGIIQPVTVTGVSILMPKALTGETLNYKIIDETNGAIEAIEDLRGDLQDYTTKKGEEWESVFVQIDNYGKRYVDLYEGESINLMAFLPPIPDLTGAKIRVHTLGSTDFVKTVEDELQAQSRITIKLPDITPETTKPNNWISKLDGSTLLKEMSIPAYVCKGTEKPDDIKKLLKKGVRAFDAEKFASIDIATKNINTDFVTVINNFLANKENSNEFVIVWVDNTALVGVQNPNKDKWISFQNKINDAKGKVVFLEKHGIGDIMTNINAITKLFGYASKKNTIDFFHSVDEWQAQIIDTDKDGNPIVEINTAIYNKIVKYKEQSGCTGIVTIPGAEKSFDSSYGDLLLQAVIDCNFKLRRNSKNQQ